MIVSTADHTDSLKIAEKMQASVRKLHELAQSVGAAKQVREYDSDRRKNALSNEIVKHLKAGQSAVAAENLGRSSSEYQAKLNVLAGQYEAAEACIARWRAEEATYEAARSLLSFSKTSMGVLGG